MAPGVTSVTVESSGRGVIASENVALTVVGRPRRSPRRRRGAGDRRRRRVGGRAAHDLGVGPVGVVVRVAVAGVGHDEAQLAGAGHDARDGLAAEVPVRMPLS